MNETECNAICDQIADDAMILDDAIAALELARIDDPTDSFHAAHIRDAIRDNFPIDP